MIRTKEKDAVHRGFPRPPLPVTVEAQKRNALVAPGDAPGVWLLIMRDGRKLTMRPRQLTGPQGGAK